VREINVKFFLGYCQLHWNLGEMTYPVLSRIYRNALVIHIGRQWAKAVVWAD
jgi:hypothetical protein